MKLKKKIFYIILLTIVFIIIMGVALNYGRKGSLYIPNNANSFAYSWKGGAIRTKGNVVPETCVLTTKTCMCALSESSNVCRFNFSLRDINHSVNVIVKRNSPYDPSITYNKSAQCTTNGSQQIQNCSVIFRWDKSHPAIEYLQIQLEGSKGTQSLLNLQIRAK